MVLEIERDRTISHSVDLWQDYMKEMNAELGIDGHK